MKNMPDKKILGKTPNGGDYSEVFYFDAEGNVADSDKATRIIIREYTADGELVFETVGFTKNVADGQAV